MSLAPILVYTCATHGIVQKPMPSLRNPTCPHPFCDRTLRGPVEVIVSDGLTEMFVRVLEKGREQGRRAVA